MSPKREMAHLLGKERGNSLSARGQSVQHGGMGEGNGSLLLETLCWIAGMHPWKVDKGEIRAWYVVF